MLKLNIIALLSLVLSVACTNSDDPKLWEEPERTASAPSPSQRPEADEEEPKEVIKRDSSNNHQAWIPDLPKSTVDDVDDNPEEYLIDQEDIGEVRSEGPYNDMFEKGVNFDKDEIRREQKRKSVNHPYRMVNSSRLNVRKAPSSKGRLKRTLSKGDEVRVYEDFKGWSKIGEGEYVRSRYLTPIAH